MVYVESGEVIISDENDMITRILSAQEYYDNNFNPF